MRFDGIYHLGAGKFLTIAVETDDDVEEVAHEQRAHRLAAMCFCGKPTLGLCGTCAWMPPWDRKRIPPHGPGYTAEVRALAFPMPWPAKASRKETDDERLSRILVESLRADDTPAARPR